MLSQIFIHKATKLARKEITTLTKRYMWSNSGAISTENITLGARSLNAGLTSAPNSLGDLGPFTSLCLMGTSHL